MVLSRDPHKRESLIGNMLGLSIYRSLYPNLGHIKLINWFSGQFFQYLMREGGIFFTVVSCTGMMWGVFFFLKWQQCDTPTLEKITHRWTIAYFSAALLVTTSCFLSSAIGTAQLVVETTSRRTLAMLTAIFQQCLYFDQKCSVSI
jgi:hypothetical protein